MLRVSELSPQLAFPPSHRPSLQVWDFPITVSLHSLQLPPSWSQTLQAAEPKGFHSLAAHHQPTVIQAASCFHLPPCGLLPYVLLSRRLDPLPHGFQASPGTPAQVAWLLQPWCPLRFSLLLLLEHNLSSELQASSHSFPGPGCALFISSAQLCGKTSAILSLCCCQQQNWWNTWELLNS